MLNKKLILLAVFLYAGVSILLNYIDNSVTKELSDRVWIHRVNSKEKLKEVHEENYKGFELDVVFLADENKFDVNHPPATSINLSLFDYLNSLDNNRSSLFWIDFKNLTPLNSFASVSRFDSICKVLKFKKEQFIIESDKPQFLKTFQISGYRTSYYLPTSLCNLPSDQQQNELELVAKNIAIYMTDYISLDKCNYALIAEKFPNKKKLLWSFPYKSRIILNPMRLIKLPKQIALKRRLLEDSNVEVVLLKYNAEQGNR
jgi:hypothetical protein